MAASKTEWRRRWLPPLLVVAGLLVLGGGVTLGLTAATRVQRFLGWLIAAGGGVQHRGGRLAAAVGAVGPW